MATYLLPGNTIYVLLCAQGAFVVDQCTHPFKVRFKLHQKRNVYYSNYLCSYIYSEDGTRSGVTLLHT